MAKKSTKKNTEKQSGVKRKMRDKVEQRKKRQHNRGGNFAVQIPDGTQFAPKKGKNHIDILPYEVNVNHHPDSERGELDISRNYWVHFGLGPEGKDKALCLKSLKKACPICEYISQLNRSDDQESKDLANKIKSKERELYNVIDLKNPNDGVKVWDISYHLFGKVLDEELNEGDEENHDFANLEGGKSLEIRMATKKIGTTEFLEATRIDFNDRDDYEESILEETHSLDEMLNFRSYEDLEKLLTGEEAPDEEEDEAEEDESDAEDDEEESEEEDEEEPPAKHKKSSNTKSSAKKSNGKGKKSSSKKKVTCPGGGVFGVDVDEFEECEDCPHYVDCEKQAEA